MNHYNVELQKPNPHRQGRYLQEKIENIHIILDEELNPVAILDKNLKHFGKFNEELNNGKKLRN